VHHGQGGYLNCGFTGFPFNCENKSESIFMANNFKAIIKRMAIMGEISMFNLYFRLSGKIFRIGERIGSVTVCSNLIAGLKGLGLISFKIRRSRKIPIVILKNMSKNCIRIFITVCSDSPA
jgi:hypothetical protein